MILKHKNMRDVACKVVGWPKGFTRGEPNVATVWWINLLGAYGSKKPFVITPKPEDILIRDLKEWEELKDVEI